MKLFQIVFEEKGSDNYSSVSYRYVIAKSIGEVNRYGEEILRAWFGGAKGAMSTDSWFKELEDGRAIKIVDISNISEMSAVMLDGGNLGANLRIVPELPEEYRFAVNLRGFGLDEDAAWENALDEFFNDPDSAEKIEEV